MRFLAFALFVLAACQHQDSAERSAQIVASKPAVAAVAPAPTPVAEAHSCGCGAGMAGMAGCSGQCGGQCGGESPNLVAPKDATWTTLHVTGMHCGGCARRIERALAGVGGVLGVKADFASAQVQVATASGVDAKRLVQPTIDGLGYRVQ